METQGQARLLASNKIVDRVKEDLIKTWPRSALLCCAAEGFNEGVKWQQQQSPWINVKDRLPDNQDLVLVKSEYNGKATAYYHGKYSGFITYGEEAYEVFGDITHWMPIPACEE